ncbi:hypothetical protein ACVIHI_009062 [Bradyrhizobium sp. USDA 4524]|nr:hypothetical protein [Bradyrhizobium sp. USDA 4538]MCP1907207.1 hypothetical protein [Bradyrhizobium sp. USDA 4537]MCP1985683.1 hypothetical protein [Bradyrhizobium sp. USDA 4539]
MFALVCRPSNDPAGLLYPACDVLMSGPKLKLPGQRASIRGPAR